MDRLIDPALENTSREKWGDDKNTAGREWNVV